MLYWSGLPCAHLIHVVMKSGGSLRYYVNSRWIEKKVRNLGTQNNQTNQNTKNTQNTQNTQNNNNANNLNQNQKNNASSNGNGLNPNGQMKRPVVNVRQQPKIEPRKMKI